MAHVRERFGVLAYARVDLLPALGGHLVLELELAEPSLFLTTAPGRPGAARRRAHRGRRGLTRAARCRSGTDLLQCHLDFPRAMP